MLNRIHVKGYKSLHDVEVKLPSLGVLFGPNAAGKSNFLDALQLLSNLGTSHTLKDAFDPPYRGKAIESFTIGEGGIKGLIEQERLTFSIEADLHLSQVVVDSVDRDIRVMRQPTGKLAAGKTGKPPSRVRERNLRYRVEIEMLPASGILRVNDEYLAALNSRGEPTRSRKPFLERQGENIHLRLEGQAHPTYFDRYLDRTILSMPHYPPHYPHLAAVRREFESWLFFYFEPRERMRALNPIKEARHIGFMGEDLAAFLRTLQALDDRQFKAVEQSLKILVPNMDGIELDVNDLGEVELRLREGGVAIPARVLSEGTLRMLGILALTGVAESPSLVGFEEPENGVHPRRISLIAELLKTRRTIGETQYIVTTHSPVLLDRLPEESLFAVRGVARQTRVDPLRILGPLHRRQQVADALSDEQDHALPVSDRVLRGDFDA